MLLCFDISHCKINNIHTGKFKPMMLLLLHGSVLYTWEVSQILGGYISPLYSLTKWTAIILEQNPHKIHSTVRWSHRGPNEGGELSNDIVKLQFSLDYRKEEERERSSTNMRSRPLFFFPFLFCSIYILDCEKKKLIYKNAQTKTASSTRMREIRYKQLCNKK